MSAQYTAPQRDFWSGRRVFVTGHTSFKGSWLSAWLTSIGAVVDGFALAPLYEPNNSVALALSDRINHQVGDVRNEEHPRRALRAYSPELIFHPAALPVVRESHRDPLGTFETNVIGTVRECAGEKSDLHEAHSLRLYSTKAKTELGWGPHIGLDDCLEMTVSWYWIFYRGVSPSELHDLALRQIASHGMTP